MDEFKSIYRRYAITLMAAATVLFGAIMATRFLYKPAMVVNTIPPTLMWLHISLLALSGLAGLSILLLRKRLLDEVTRADFKGNIAQTLANKGYLVVAPSLVSLLSGLTLVYAFNIDFNAVIVYFYIFIGAYYIGFIRSNIWRDILERDALK